MKVGFIGCGNMASAMIGGILKNEIIPDADIMASVLRESSLERVQNTLGIAVTLDNRKVAEWADILFLAVKPQYFEDVTAEIKDVIRTEQVIVSIAAGKTIAWLENALPAQTKIVRCMPNTPALVGEGITGVCRNAHVNAEELDEVCRILSGCGKTEVLDEKMIDVVIGVSGSSPAYVYMFIEAMADAAVADGMPRAQAYKFASQAILGSAKMVLETGKHPGELKDAVCSPGGTTIEAVRVLEAKGFRSAVIEAMKACVKKAREM